MTDPVDHKKLRDLRIDNNIKQKELAAKLNITSSAYSRLERGERQLRTEQLNIIAKALGKNITDLFKKSVQSDSNEPNGNSLRAEIDLLESMLYLLSVGVEQELDSLDNRYINKYEPVKFSYADFIKNDSGDINPQMALSQFKKYIQEYEDLKDRPYEWYKEQMEKLYPNLNQRDKNPDWINSLITWREKFEFNGNHPFNDFFGAEEYDYFQGKSDEFIMDFILIEDNFNFVEIITNDGVGSGYSYSVEDNYSAFKDLLEDNPLAKLLFEYGFLSQSRHSYFWSKYREEKGVTSRLFVESENNEVITKIHDKMKDISHRKSTI